MKIDTESLEDNKVKVRVEVPAKDVDSYIKKTYSDLSKKYNFPGFRRGKAPRPVIDNMIGKEAILASITEEVINDIYPKVIDEKRIYPVGQPEFTNEDMVVSGKDFAFEFTQEVMPEFELTSYEPVEVEVPQSEVTEAEIDEQVDAFRKHYAGNAQDEDAEIILPDLTDEWVNLTMGFDNIEDLRKSVADSISAQKKGILPRIKENACAAELEKRFEGEVPDALAEQTESDLLQEFFTQLQRQGLTFDQYLSQSGIDNVQFKEDIKRQAEDECKRNLALDAWARHHKITVSDEDLLTEFKNAGVDEPQAAMKQWRDAGRLYLVREGVLRTKAMDDVIETAKVTEVDISKLAKNDEDAKSAEGGSAGAKGKKKAAGKASAAAKSAAAKSAAAKSSESTKKADAAKEAPTKKTGAAKTTSPTKKIEPAKGAAPTKKIEPAKGSAPTKKA